MSSLPFIQFYSTQKCNSFCKHCYLAANSSGIDERKEIELNSIVNALTQLKDLGGGLVAIGGAEPTTRDDFDQIIQALGELGYKVKLHTNGMLLTEERVKLLKKCQVFEVRISLDGSNKQVNDWIRGNGTFDRIISGINNAIKYDVPVTIAITLSKQNFDDVSKIIDLAFSLGVSAVHSYLLIDKGRGENLQSLILDEQQKKELHQLFAKKRIEYKAEDVKKLTDDKPCIHGIPFISLRQNGDIQLYSNSKADYGVGIHFLGNISNESIQDMLSSYNGDCSIDCSECDKYGSLECYELDNYCFDDIYFRR